MKKYPVDLADNIASYEQATGDLVDDQTKEIMALVTELENQAYEQGLKDGFMQPFKDAAKEVRTNPKFSEKPAPELEAVMQEIREALETSFEEEGFETVLDNLGPAPDDMNWGQKCYRLAEEAFILGGIYAICKEVEKKEETSDAGN